MNKTWISIGILVVLIGITIFFNVNKTNISDLDNEAVSGEVKAVKGYIAPNFTISDEDGHKVKLSDFRGKPVFINFWASWCPPCIEEMPFIQEAYTKYHQDIEFLMINVIELDTIKDVQTFMEDNGFTFPVLLDKDNKVTNLYNVYGYPTSFFINSQGVVQEMVIGGMDKDMFDHEIQKLLKN